MVKKDGYVHEVNELEKAMAAMVDGKIRNLA